MVTITTKLTALWLSSMLYLIPNITNRPPIGFDGGSVSKESPAVQETWVQSLGWEDPREEGMATHSSILAWRIHMDRGAWWATVHGVAKIRTRLSDFASLGGLRPNTGMYKPRDFVEYSAELWS